MNPQFPQQPTLRHYVPPQYSPPAHHEAPQAAEPASPQEVQRELEHAIVGSQEVLCTANTSFPFTLFPDTITLDRAKLTITHRIFFGLADVMSIRIEDILNVTAVLGPILGSIQIRARIFSDEKPYVINKFLRNDALRVKRITQGYIIALQREIDCSSVPAPQLALMLEKLGTDAHDT